MSDLVEAQFDLDGYLFGGAGHPVQVLADGVDFGSPDIRGNDSDRPRADGRTFGREWRSGRTITIEVAVLDEAPQGALVELGRLTAAWDATAVRRHTEVTQVLRWRLGGRTRRVWGRARRVAPDPNRYYVGKIVTTLAFDSEGPYTFGDEPAINTLGITSSSTGGFVFPVSFPLHTSGVGEIQGGIDVAGDVPAPVVLTIRGPISDPVVEAIGQWRLQLLGQFAHDEVVTVDSRPWSQRVVNNFGQNLAGRLSTSSPRLPDVRLDPGVRAVVLKGVDSTGTASLDVEAWAAHTAF